jgi:hypothetical protein
MGAFWSWFWCLVQPLICVLSSDFTCAAPECPPEPTTDRDSFLRGRVLLHQAPTTVLVVAGPPSLPSIDWDDGPFDGHGPPMSLLLDANILYKKADVGASNKEVRKNL